MKYSELSLILVIVISTIFYNNRSLLGVKYSLLYQIHLNLSPLLHPLNPLTLLLSSLLPCVQLLEFLCLLSYSSLSSAAVSEVVITVLLSRKAKEVRQRSVQYHSKRFVIHAWCVAILSSESMILV